MTISTKDPAAMDQTECLAELHRLKECEPPLWRKRAERLVRRLSQLAAPEPEEIDVLDARIKAVMSTKPRPRPGEFELGGFKVRRGKLGGFEAEQRHNGALMHDAPSVEFDFAKVDGEATNETHALLLELLADLLAFMGRNGEGETAIHREYELLRFYVRPYNHSDLALRLGVKRSRAAELATETGQCIRDIIGRRGQKFLGKTERKRRFTGSLPE